jgi:hypothetical protein
MTKQGVKIGRPKKDSTGKTMFIPAHLVKYVMAMLKADKTDSAANDTLAGLSSE